MGRRTFAGAALAVGAVALAGCSGSGSAPGIPTVVQVATGDFHTCALLADGTVRCWGDNVLGQLGDGTTVDRWTPTPVSSLAGVTAIAAGAWHTCALLADGTARCWGANYDGALGDGTDVDRSSPVAVRGIDHAATTAAPGATLLSTRWRHTCALLADATVRCWGDNRVGQLGDGTSDDRSSAVPVSGLTGVRSIAAGRDHTCALLADRSVRCWGRDEEGRLGSTGSSEICDPYLFRTPCVTSPRGVPGLGLVDAITAGEGFTCALVGGASVSGWGSNSDGQLLAPEPEYAPTPIQLEYLWSVGTIAAGGAHACAIGLDGSVACWGRDDDGQLGHGAPGDHARGAVDGLGSASAIAAGLAHTCAIAPGRGVLCWGRNVRGQLGDGTTVDRRTPVGVHGLAR